MNIKTVNLMTAVIAIAVLASAGLALSLEATGLAKPLADLRDYNGTYSGSIGTGTIGYSGGTLYRDNQDSGAFSGCMGEGCGRHPGVDIPVPSGTSVYSSLSGVIVRSECNDSWGGLIVIESYNPWNYSEKIYQTYAHLKSRRYSNGSLVLVGDYVSVGAKIGSSGGGSGDSCAGRSTGSHLHFQIDKDDGNNYPWYPRLSELNQKDSSFAVSSKTYNPIVFITGGYRWSFNNPQDRESWDIFNFQAWGASGGALWADFGSDPYFRRFGTTVCGHMKTCSASINAEATEYPNVYLDYYSNCSTGASKIYFATASEPFFDESKTVSFSSWYGSNNAHVYMGYHPKWQGVITGIRFDPAENCSIYSSDPIYLGEITIER